MKEKSNKLYVLIQTGVTGMGGGQMYICNKADYMKALGWEVIIFSSLPGDILIPKLKGYRNIIMQELISAPFVYKAKIVSLVLNKMYDNVKEAEEIVIESGAPHCVYWGELLAQKIQGKHLIFMLSERPDLDISKEYLPFYQFKLQRRELAGITKNTLELIFKKKNKDLEEKYVALSAICQNVVEDYDSEIVNRIPEEGITIGILGRLDKSFVAAATIELVEFVKKHKAVQFNIIYIGASEIGNREKEIRKLFFNISNVNIIFLGYVYPIPEKLFPLIRIFISSAGSAGVAYGQGNITISVDGKDGKAIGIMGYTTTHSLYREDEPVTDISFWLEEILFYNYLEGKVFTPKQRSVGTDRFVEHLKFLNDSEKTLNYYPVNMIRAKGKDKKKKIICRILGCKLYVKLRPLYSKLKEIF